MIAIALLAPPEIRKIGEALFAAVIDVHVPESVKEASRAALDELISAVGREAPAEWRAVV